MQDQVRGVRWCDVVWCGGVVAWGRCASRAVMMCGSVWLEWMHGDDVRWLVVDAR